MLLYFYRLHKIAGRGGGGCGWCRGRCGLCSIRTSKLEDAFVSKEVSTTAEMLFIKINTRTRKLLRFWGEEGRAGADCKGWMGTGDRGLGTVRDGGGKHKHLLSWWQTVQCVSSSSKNYFLKWAPKKISLESMNGMASNVLWSFGGCTNPSMIMRRGPLITPSLFIGEEHHLGSAVMTTGSWPRNKLINQFGLTYRAAQKRRRGAKLLAKKFPFSYTQWLVFNGGLV